MIAVGRSTAGAVVGTVHGFVPALTSFVGRDQALAEVAGLLERNRLVTVTGPGGSGKTRLAAEVARRVADRFADGVWLAELAPVRDPEQVPSAVAVVLGIREQPGETTEDTLVRALAGQQLLLVLDNCEHVVEAAAGLCAGLLPVADDVRVLATSREPLHVAGEARYRLAPLALPGPDDPADAGAEAVVLFADRARSVDARFALDGQTGPVVARLVARLDGMPLAIELAAAWVEALGLVPLLEHLDNRFDLLTAGDRAAADRHRSLAATVAWSYRLLDEPERRVFRAVSLFCGPFTLEGAEAVAGAGAGPAVLRLVDCSLLVPPRIDPDGRSRYVMLETLRGYAARLLAEAGEQEQAATRLAGHALQVAEQTAAGLGTSSRELAAARWLDAEDATMRQAVTWASQRDPAIALRLAVALAPLCFLRGRLAGEYPVLQRAASHAELLAGDMAGAERSCVAVLARSRDVGDLRNLATGLTHLAILDLRAGRLDDSAAHLRELLQLAGRTGSRVDVLNGLDCCGHLCAATGRPAEAVTIWAACAALLRQDGFTEAPAEAARRDEPRAEARQAVGQDRARAAEDRGAAMSLATAAEYALLLTTPGPRPEPPSGLAGLSTRERELVILVALGRTDAEIAAQLYISLRTVHSHLDRIRDKTGARRRADLTRLALAAGLV